MSEFKPGEVAILHLCAPRPPGRLREECPPSGSECELIKRVACPMDGLGWDCLFPGYPNPRAKDGVWWVPEYMLRKRRPPEQPADEDFQRDLDKWLKRDREVVA